MGTPACYKDLTDPQGPLASGPKIYLGETGAPTLGQPKGWVKLGPRPVTVRSKAEG
jgi:hypothetical protein